MIRDERSYPPAISLATLPATAQQRRLAFGVALVQLAVFLVVGQFAATPLPRLDAFIPTLEGLIFVNDLITSILLFSQYSIIRSRALLVLAGSYLFTSLMVIPHALTFPGAFAPAGLLATGPQTTPWLYWLWHIGQPMALVAYAYLKDENHTTNSKDASTEIAWCAAIVIGLVTALVWGTIAWERYLPSQVIGTSNFFPQTILAFVIFSAILIVEFVALVLLWIRRSSVLDYWLIILVSTLLSEQMLGILSKARFTVGFYAGRGYSLATSMFVLALLLTETTRLYRRLARANVMLQRERDNKLMNIQAVMASVAHEVRQPLTAIGMNASSALKILEMQPLDTDEIREVLRDIRSDTDRTHQVLNGIRALFGKGGQERQPIGMNEIIVDVLRTLQGELRALGVETRSELSPELPPVSGHRGQLQELIFNLVHNALEAMGGTTSRTRVLRVATELRGRNAIAVAVEDSGPGIDPNRLDSIFGAFFTTKPQGTGLGLAICRMIVEHHGGQLSASSDGKSGAFIEFVLPIGLADYPDRAKQGQ